MKQTPKLTKAAKEWIESVVRYRVYDCCDSMRDSEKMEARFDALADDKISIDDYVKKFLAAEYIKAIKECADEAGDDASEKNWKEFLDGTPSKFPDWVVNYFDK